jgi:hypothetical protein
MRSIVGIIAASLVSSPGPPAFHVVVTTPGACSESTHRARCRRHHSGARAGRIEDTVVVTSPHRRHLDGRRFGQVRDRPHLTVAVVGIVARVPRQSRGYFRRRVWPRAQTANSTPYGRRPGRHSELFPLPRRRRRGRPHPNATPPPSTEVITAGVRPRPVVVPAERVPVRKVAAVGTASPVGVISKSKRLGT